LSSTCSSIAASAPSAFRVRAEFRTQPARLRDAAIPQTTTETSDQELIARVREARDRDAMAALYDRYARSVHGLALSILHEPRAAEDVTQDVFLTFWQRPDSYVAARGTFGPWILRVCRNRAIDQLRRRGRERFVDDERQEWVVDSDPEPDDQVWSLTVARQVRSALAELSEVQRQVIELAYFGGMSQSEMALQLQVPLGTVKTRVRAALQRLAQVMAAETWDDVS
jgi:RNA polymerase sigma-70 factor, ECF subfamily